jgi:DNA-binding beta-propeller fold protein YncE
VRALPPWNDAGSEAFSLNRLTMASFLRRVGVWPAIGLVIGGLLLAGGAYAWDRVGASGPNLPLRTVGDFPLSGRTTRFDYASFDANRGVMWIAHMGDGAVEAFDVRTNRVTRTVPISPAASVRGVLAARGNVYAAAQGLSAVIVLDGESGERRAAVPAGDADGLAYDPATQRIFVSDEAGGQDVVIDARANRRIGEIALGGEAGNTVYDPVSRHIFAGVQTRDELAEIDPVRMTVVRRYPLLGCSSSHSVVVDGEQRAAYVGCQRNMQVVRLDLAAGKVTRIGGAGIGVDVMALDPATHRLYVASESGIVSVYDVSGRRLHRIAQAFLHLNAHVVAIDPATHRVYFPLQNAGGRPVMRVLEPR